MVLVKYLIQKFQLITQKLGVKR